MLHGLPMGELLSDVGCLSLGSCMFLRFPSLPVSRRHLLRLAGRLLSNRQLLAACLCICESCSDPSEFFERRFSLFQVGGIESSAIARPAASMASGAPPPLMRRSTIRASCLKADPRTSRSGESGIKSRASAPRDN